MTTAREPATTVSFVDQYCSHYQNLFPDVRTFERFKNLQLGLISEVKRKTLPAVARVVGADPQALHHFLTRAPWSTTPFRKQRLALTEDASAGRGITVCIDDTGDRKKGEHTDKEALPEESTRYTMTNLPGKIDGTVGNWPWLELLGKTDIGLALQRLMEHMNGFRVFLQV